MKTLRLCISLLLAIGCGCGFTACNAADRATPQSAPQEKQLMPNDNVDSDCPDGTCPENPDCPDGTCPENPDCPDGTCPENPDCPDGTCPENPEIPDCPDCPEKKNSDGTEERPPRVLPRKGKKGHFRRRLPLHPVPQPPPKPTL